MITGALLLGLLATYCTAENIGRHIYKNPSWQDMLCLGFAAVAAAWQVAAIAQINGVITVTKL